MEKNDQIVATNPILRPAGNVAWLKYVQDDEQASGLDTFAPDYTVRRITVQEQPFGNQ